MSQQPTPNKRITVPQIKAKKGVEKITAVTAYDFSAAQILDGEVDILLVGDSLGMVVYGMDSTLPVTVEIMSAHTKAVVKGSSKSIVVADLPFASYQESPAQAYRNSARLIAETGCQAVKLEGGAEMAETVKFLSERGIPVMGHIGMQPQSFNAYGGFKVQGRAVEDAENILNAAKKLEAAGCFAIVVEAVEKKLADKITAAIKIPTIGIGASPECDGQVLVFHDLVGLSASAPKFAKAYVNLREQVSQAVKAYASDVKAKKFPTEENTYTNLQAIKKAGKN